MKKKKIKIKIYFTPRPMKPEFYNVLSCVHMPNLHPVGNLLPGANLRPGANLHPLASRSYANKLCPYAPRFYLKFNTSY